jgi:hypothetical protein
MKTALVTIAALGALALGPERPPPDAAWREARRVIDGYVTARNRHDADALAALTDKNIRAFDAEGNPHPPDEKRLRDVLAWERAMNARWTGKVLAWDGSWIEVEFSEENDLFDALGIGAAVQRDRIRVEHGRIVEWRGLSERSTGREEAAAISEFKRWIETLSTELREGALKGGQLLLDERGAEAQRVLIRRWRAEKRNPE